MEKDRFEAFWHFAELSAEKQLKLSLYKGLNKIIQKEKIESDLVNGSVSKIVLDTWNKDIDWSDYSEMDYQVKLLVEEHKISVENIYEFVENKFPLKKQAYIDILKEMEFVPVFERQKVVDTIFEKEKGIFTVRFSDIEWNPIDIFSIKFNINWDFVENLEYFKNKALDIDLNNYLDDNLTYVQSEIWILA